jgi:hypothetical protein
VPLARFTSDTTGAKPFGAGTVTRSGDDVVVAPSSSVAFAVYV